MATFFDSIARHYQQDVVDTGKQAQLLILVSFILTFLVVRAITHAIRAGRTRVFRDVTAGGTHIHHLVWGILLLLVTGYLAIGVNSRGVWWLLAILYGLGAALTLDEFALWLELKDNYWSKDGRRSIDAVVVFITILALILLGLRFWVNVGREVLHLG